MKGLVQSKIKGLQANSKLIEPKPQLSFTKYQYTCPWHRKARCGRAFCYHEVNKREICNRLNCPFFREAEQLMKPKRTRNSMYRVPRRYRGAVL